VELQPARVEDVPVPELSGLALVPGGDGSSELLAIGDRKSLLVWATLGDGPLDWSTVEVGQDGRREGQFEGLAVTADGMVLMLREDPPSVLVHDRQGGVIETLILEPGVRDRLSDVLSNASSSGEGLLALRGGRLLVAQEKDPALLVELGPQHSEASGVSVDSFPLGDERWGGGHGRLQALAAWKLDGVKDVSDLAFADGVLYCLSDQSRRVVAVDLPLDPGSRRAVAGDRWDLSVPERQGEPDGKPEGLVVAADGAFIVGLDTRTAGANLCWYRP
jgi:hypothetical protein